MILFQQQLLKQLLIKNSSFTDIESGVIFVEAANKQSLEYETKVAFEDVIFDSIAFKYGSLILNNEGGNIEIYNSQFSNIYCFEEGAVIFAGYQRTSTSIYSSVFTNCTSIQGGVFNVDSESIIKVYNSQIYSNFAVISGVIQANNNGYYEFHNCSIHDNIGLSSSVSQVFDVAKTPIIDN